MGLQRDDASGGAAGPPGNAAPEQPISDYLRQQRILRGMSREELAELTRIPIRSLERLESGQFDGGTDGFVRGFVRTVAQALGLDVEDAVTRLLQEPGAVAWERPRARRSLQRALAALAGLALLAFVLVGVQAAWRILLGEASQPRSREVVLWRDPVRALAEATGAGLETSPELAPPADGPLEEARDEVAAAER